MDRNCNVYESLFCGEEKYMLGVNDSTNTLLESSNTFQKSFLWGREIYVGGK